MPPPSRPAAAPHPAAARGRRRRAVLGCAAAAVALNVGVLVAFAGAAQPPAPRVGGPGLLHRSAVWVTATPAAVAPETPPPRPAPVRVTAAPEPRSFSPAAAPLANPVAPPAPAAPGEPPSAAPPGAVPTDTTAAEPAGSDTDTRFYAHAEVDRPAEPDSDWNLDPAALDSAGLQALSFEIYIGREGEVVACSILTPADLPADTRAQLEERLRQTVLQPAWRGGVTVPSVRRIEVKVLPPAA